MKNKEFQKLLKKNKFKSNSGFTLTELLVGVIMSTIVIGGLGWGVMQVLNITQSQTSKSATRNEASRAFSFISDELKRAESLEVNTSSVNLSTVDNAATPDIDETVAPSFTLPTGGTTILAMNIPNVPQRVIYYVAPPQSDIWRGPLVIYRWGPALNADGSYSETSIDDDTDPDNWQAQALIDKVDNTSRTTTCNGSSVSYQGFYACVDDPDGDGLGISAQLFFTGGTDAIGSEDDGNYAAETQVVARARTAPATNTDTFSSYTMSYKTLGAVYGCKLGSPDWEMRTDFINNPSNPDNEDGNTNKKWKHDPTRQPQPIKIDTSKNLIISSIPINRPNAKCISKGGDAPVDGGTYENHKMKEGDSAYYQDEDGNYTLADKTTPLPKGTDPIFREELHRVTHTVDFDNPVTYNGYTDDNNDVYVGYGSDSTVLFLRPGDIVPENPGYDPDDNSDTSEDSQKSLREFLEEKGYMDASTNEVIKINQNERIVIFEVGQTDSSHPGFDRQDNIFILSSDVFAKDAPTPTPYP